MNNSNLQAWGTTLLRIVVGVVFLMHGRQKLFVWGFHGVGQFFGTVGVPFPGFFAVVVTLLEFIGGAALVVGLFTRPIAALLAVVPFGVAEFLGADAAAEDGGALRALDAATVNRA